MSPHRISGDPSAIGNLARIYGFITTDQLRRAVAWHEQNPHIKLGESMVNLGMITPMQVRFLVDKQREVRSTCPKQASARDMRAYVDFATRQLRESPLMERLKSLAKKKPPSD